MHDIFGWLIAIAGITAIGAFARYILRHRHEDYFTLDCRDGNHSACETCSCRCHVLHKLRDA